MALFAMSDLHLSLTADKPMDVFGSVWHNYMDKIYTGWHSCVTAEDTVIVGGDISWAMYLEDACEDLKFLNDLPGRKILMRGNHDYWWESLTKLKSFVASKGFDTIHFLQNDAYLCGDVVIAGTRGWLLPGSEPFSSKDRKIYERELIRLDLSLAHGMRLADGRECIAVLHYPPVNCEGVPDDGIYTILKRYGIRRCLYGHIHGPATREYFSGEIDGIHYSLVSADHLNFKPCNLGFL